MARKIIWTLEVAADLESIATYIARDSHFYSKSFVREIINASLSLKEFPERGRIVPEFSNSAVHELFIKEYRLIYKIEESRIVILGIIHGKRNLRLYPKKTDKKRRGDDIFNLNQNLALKYCFGHSISAPSLCAASRGQ